MLLATLLALSALFIPPSPASPSPAFRCPFTELANGTLVPDPPPEDGSGLEDGEEREDIVWCLPKTYLMERPPFGGETVKGEHSRS